MEGFKDKVMGGEHMFKKKESGFKEKRIEFQNKMEFGKQKLKVDDRLKAKGFFDSGKDVSNLFHVSEKKNIFKKPTISTKIQKPRFESSLFSTTKKTQESTLFSVKKPNIQKPNFNMNISINKGVGRNPFSKPNTKMPDISSYNKKIEGMLHRHKTPENIMALHSIGIHKDKYSYNEETTNQPITQADAEKLKKATQDAEKLKAENERLKEQLPTKFEAAADKIRKQRLNEARSQGQGKPMIVQYGIQALKEYRAGRDIKKLHKKTMETKRYEAAQAREEALGDLYKQLAQSDPKGKITLERLEALRQLDPYAQSKAGNVPYTNIHKQDKLAGVKGIKTAMMKGLQRIADNTDNRGSMEAQAYKMARMTSNTGSLGDYSPRYGEQGMLPISGQSKSFGEVTNELMRGSSGTTTLQSKASMLMGPSKYSQPEPQPQVEVQQPQPVYQAPQPRPTYQPTPKPRVTPQESGGKIFSPSSRRFVTYTRGSYNK